MNNEHTPPAYVVTALQAVRHYVEGQRRTSYTELARAIGVSPTALSLIVRGRRLPSHDVLERLLRAVGLQVTISVDDPVLNESM